LENLVSSAVVIVLTVPLTSSSQSQIGNFPVGGWIFPLFEDARKHPPREVVAGSLTGHQRVSNLALNVRF
jgi:hypothetical protein